MHVDVDRLMGRLSDLAEIGATGDGGCARLALTDDDRAGRDLVVTWMEDLGLDVGIDAIGNVVGTCAGPTHRLAPVMTRLATSTPSRTGGRFDGNSACSPGSRWSRRSTRAGVETSRTRSRSRSSPTRRARASRPTCSAASCTSGGLPLEDALDIVGHRRRACSATSWCASATPGRMPCPGPAAARLRRAAHRAGPGARGRGHHDRRGHRRAGHLVAGAHRSRGQSNHAGTTPMAHAPRRRLRRRRDRRRSCASSPTRSAAPRSAPSAASTLHPNLVNVVAGTRDAHRRPAQHRRGDAAAEAERRLADVLRRARARARASTIDAPVAGPVRAGRRSTPRRGRPRRADGRGARATRCAACRRAPATTPRCSPGCARRGWSSCPASAASATTRPSTPTRPTSRPAPTCCSTCCCDAGRPNRTSRRGAES